MDVLKAALYYVDRVINAVEGMKIVLLDKETTGMVSMVATQSYLLEREVFLVERLEDSEQRQPLHALKCLVYCRPSQENIERLIKELREPKYSEYYLYFTNSISEVWLETLAEADEFQVVKDIQEYFGDYYAVDGSHFTLNMPDCIGINMDTWNPAMLERCTASLKAVLLALKRRPLIRYDRNSPMAFALASSLAENIAGQGDLFSFRRLDTMPVLLIVDRRSDLMTSLLIQWSYQAMVHDLFTIQNGRARLSESSKKDSPNEVVLSPTEDSFFAKHQHSNFGELGASVQALVEDYRKRTQVSSRLDSIQDMKKFMEEYPEFRKLGGHVQRHVALASELSDRVEREGLLSISELQQNIACASGNGSRFLRAIGEFIWNPRIEHKHKLNLVIIYALKFARSPGFDFLQLVDLLRSHGFPAEDLSLIDFVLKLAIAENDSHSQRESARHTALLKRAKEADNVYTQHVPSIVKTLDALANGRLRETAFPFLNLSTTDNATTNAANERPQDIIIFFVNGSTYAEAAAIASFALNMPAIRIVLGGTFVHNTASLLGEIRRIQALR